MTDEKCTEGSPAASAKDETGTNLSNSVFQDPQEFCSIVRKNYADMDGNGDRALSRDELRAYIARTDGSDKASGELLLSHFDDVTKLAVPQINHKEMMGFSGYAQGNEKWREFMGYDRTKIDGISMKDIDALDFCMNDQKVAQTLEQLRRDEICAGVTATAFGAVMTFGGVAVTVMDPFPGVLLGTMLVGGGAAALENGIRDLRGNGDIVRAEIDSRRNVINGWDEFSAPR